MSEMEMMYEELVQQAQQKQEERKQAEAKSDEEQIAAIMQEVQSVADVCASLPGVEVTIQGTWVLVSGNTKPYAKLLGFNYEEINGEKVQKGLGLHWKRHLQRWDYHGPKLPEGWFFNKKTKKIQKRGE